MDAFLQETLQELERLYKEYTHASWMVNTTGKKEWQEKEAKAETAYRKFLAEPERFKRIRQGLETSKPGTVEHRVYQVIYNESLSNQLPPEMLEQMVNLSSKLSNIFNTFRATVDGKKLTENQVRQTLLHSKNVDERKKVWTASKRIAEEVVPGLLKLVRLRNRAAEQLGFADYYEMMFTLDELDLKEVFGIFQDLKRRSDEPFRKMKEEIDEELRQNFGFADQPLRPWHYLDPFFQEAPHVKGADITEFLKDRNIEKITVDTFSSMGMEIRDLLAKSDLYEREGKNQHAFCLDLDRNGDVRVLCNIRNNQYWMETMLHEFGHAVYDKYVDRTLPFAIRKYAHIFTTEAVAMYFGRMCTNREWLEKFLGLSQEKLDEMMPALEKQLTRQMLITARWVMTFVNFERELYKNPDQDLNRLWWQIVQEYQYVHPPEETDYPHWASKIHFTIAPVYYQNYLLGELTASQLDQYIRRNISQEIFNEKTGKFFIEKFFFPGDRYGWRKKIEMATGEPLNPKYFIEQFVK